MSKKIIDVSYAQGKKIEWDEVKSSGISGAIVRVGYGREYSQKDSCFEINYKNAKAAGIPVLPYHYSYTKDAAGAKKEAECFLNWVDGKTFANKIVFFDIEEHSQYNLGTTKLRAIINAYASVLKPKGWEVIVYSYKYFLDRIGVSWLNSTYRVWIAQYSSSCSYVGEKVLWQYTSSGKVSGYSGAVDLSYLYNDNLFAPSNKIAIDKRYGTSMLSKNAKSKGEFVKNLQTDLKYLGYMKTNSGTFGILTDRAVKKFQAAYNLEVDGIVGNNTKKALYNATH